MSESLAERVGVRFAEFHSRWAPKSGPGSEVQFHSDLVALLMLVAENAQQPFHDAAAAAISRAPLFFINTEEQG